MPKISFGGRRGFWEAQRITEGELPGTSEDIVKDEGVTAPAKGLA